MSLEEEYPKTCRKRSSRIAAVLGSVSDLSQHDREELALSMNQMADKARDLDDIVDRLLNEKHSVAEVAQLLIAFELTTEQLRGHSDTIDGKLYQIAEAVGRRTRDTAAASSTSHRKRRHAG